MSNIFKLSTQVEHVQSTVKDTIPSSANTPHRHVSKPKQPLLPHPFISRYTVHYSSPTPPLFYFLPTDLTAKLCLSWMWLKLQSKQHGSTYNSWRPSTMISPEKNSSTLCISFIWLTGWLAEEERERQTKRKKQELRGAQTEMEGFFGMHECVCALTPLRNDLWQGSKFDFLLRVNVTGLENSWHSFRHCTPSAYHHPTLPNGNDTCPLE